MFLYFFDWFHRQLTHWRQWQHYLLPIVLSSAGNQLAGVLPLWVSSGPSKKQKEGFSPILSCGVFLYAHNTLEKYWSHWFSNLAACFRSIAFNVQLNLSIMLSHSGWYAIVFSLVILKSLRRSLIKYDNRLVPLLVSSASGTPKKGSHLISDMGNWFCFLIREWLSQGPLGEIVLYISVVSPGLGKLHQICTNNLEWSTHRYWM